MFDQNQINQFKEEVTSAQSVAILLPPDPATDLVAAGLGLYLTFQNSGKQVQVGCGSEIRVENADLFGVDKIKNSIGNQNLIISFDFKEENLKKVDYDVDENGKFMLLIQPQSGCEAPDTSSINYSYSGASADLVFVLGINSLEELGKIYADEKSFLDKAKIISLNLTAKQSNIASLAFHSMNATCLSETVGLLIKSADLKPTADAASNLLSVISEKTNQFASPKVSPDTFETVAYLMRAGGHLGRSPYAGSSRFGAFPPRPSEAFGVRGSATSPFGGNPFGGSPFMGSPLTPPTFDDDLSDEPDFPETPAFPPRPSEAFGVGGPRPFQAPSIGGGAPAFPPRRKDRVPNDWKKPKVFKGGNRGVSQA